VAFSFLKTTMQILQTLGIASYLGGTIESNNYGAEVVRDDWQQHALQHKGLQLQWHLLYPENKGSKYAQLLKLNQAISDYTQCWVEQKKVFLVISGDHSSALGTWAGVLNGLEGQQQLGLLWLDAHMDAHTFITTPSGNIHGMPLSALLGKADQHLIPLCPTRKYIKAEHLILLGTRSYEAEEQALLEKNGVSIVFAKELTEIISALVSAIDKLSQSCDKIGISIDLDCLDPEDAPGVETPVNQGVKAQALLQALTAIRHQSKICGLEISEFAPTQDRQQKTLHLINDIVETFYA
jgi:arginase